MLRSVGLFVFVACLAIPVYARAEGKQIVIPWSDKIDTVVINDGINRLKITSNDSVSIRVTQFNYLHYSLKFTIEERTIESYVMLDRLWSQIFKLAPLMEAAAPGFDGAIVAWRRNLANADARLGDYVKKFAGKVSLAPEDCADIGRQAGPLGSEPMARLEALRRDVLDQAETSSHFDLYERVLAQHQNVIDRLSAFVTAAGLVEHGSVEPLGKKKAGTVVTFTITPVGAKGAFAGEPFQANYFVRSTRPLMLHVGYAASSLKDVEFDRVRAASGSDLFLSTKDETTQSLATFLSYEFWRWGPTHEIGVHATLGTSFQKPGENMFFGGGIRITHFVVSAGASGTTVSEGHGRVLEPVAGAAGVRELFTTITSQQHWGPFFAVSVRVF